MNLFEKLPQEEVHQLWQYLDCYSDGCALPESKMSYFLRFWQEAKQPFYRMFGEQFIIKKDVMFDKPFDELKGEMEDAVYYGHGLVSRFATIYKNRVREICRDDYDMRDNLFDFVENLTVLVNNEYNGESFTIPGEHTVTGRPLVVNHGCKAVKMLGKIATAIGVKTGDTVCKSCGCITNGNYCSCGGEVHYVDGYEAFRLAHSLVLNQKTIRGKLCLSIHPLDFLTMSDNECDWTSCMSWVEEYGDYRLGTIEMMNSPCVVIAYVEAKNNMQVCGREWSNKRWRQLFIVTREMILGNRQYPYASDVVQGAALQWLRSMCQEAVGWGPYTEETHQIRNDAWNTLQGSFDVKFNIDCNYMYNDVYNRRLAYIAPSRFEDMRIYELNFSGPAVCTGCGDVIPYEEVDPSQVQCRTCSGYWKCDCCDNWHPSYEESNYVDGYVYCDWCYSNHTEVCECCGTRVRSTNHVYIQFVNTENEDIIRDFNYNFYVSMCDDCIEDKDYYLEIYGPLYEVRDMWGCRRLAFDVRNITDYGLREAGLSEESVTFLQSMRSSQSDVERLSLIREFSY